MGKLLDRVLSGVVPRHSTTWSRALDLSELEERILLSASPVMTVAEMADAALAEMTTANSATIDYTAQNPSSQTQSSSSTEESNHTVTTDPSQATTRELAFLDTSVEDYQTLLNDL